LIGAVEVVDYTAASLVPNFDGAIIRAADNQWGAAPGRVGGIHVARVALQPAKIQVESR